jgi:cysteine synthase B
MAREEGVLTGISSGANLVAASRIAKQEVEAGRRAVIVTIICDGADKYLSEHFWDDQN